jgi:NAD(P)-dependent dehydrogenase (short-subunit alcohol dehydrogenase family)
MSTMGETMTAKTSGTATSGGTDEITVTGAERGPQLLGQTVVLLGGSAGIGYETARLAGAEGAEVVLVGRDQGRLERAGAELGAKSTAAFDATDPDLLQGFLRDLPGQIDHVLVTAGASYYAPLAEIDFSEARREIDAHVWLPMHLARDAVGKVRPGGSLIFMSGTGARRPGVGLAVAATFTAAMPALIANLALEIAPIRVNLIAAGFVDTPLSAKILGADLDARREQLRETLPIRRVVGPEDVAALAVQLMANTALTGATYDIDGGQQIV